MDSLWHLMIAYDSFWLPPGLSSSQELCSACFYRHQMWPGTEEIKKIHWGKWFFQFSFFLIFVVFWLVLKAHSKERAYCYCHIPSSSKITTHDRGASSRAAGRFRVFCHKLCTSLFKTSQKYRTFTCKFRLRKQKEWVKIKYFCRFNIWTNEMKLPNNH